MSCADGSLCGFCLELMFHEKKTRRHVQTVIHFSNDYLNLMAKCTCNSPFVFGVSFY